jgi:hypothetical protein
MVKRRTAGGAGFYGRRTRRVEVGSEQDEMRRRLRELVFRTPEEKRLLIAALRALSGGRKEDAKEAEERLKSLLKSLTEQLM